MNEEEVKKVINETITAVRKEKVVIKLAAPTTLHGWLLLCLAFGAVGGAVWKSFEFIHVVTKHHEAPHHAGAAQLVERIEQSVAKHIEEGQHIHEAELEMKIVKQTEPIKRDIQLIQQDVGAIRTRVDILLDREERRNGGDGLREH